MLTKSQRQSTIFASNRYDQIIFKVNNNSSLDGLKAIQAIINIEGIFSSLLLSSVMLCSCLVHVSLTADDRQSKSNNSADKV